MLRRQLVTGLLMTVVLTVLLGFVYPLAVTGIGGKAGADVVLAAVGCEPRDTS